MSQDRLSLSEYRSLKARAEASQRSCMVRIRRIAAEAGISPEMPFLHASNALCALHYGQPWPNVDYSKVRLVRRLEGEMWTASRLVDAIASRRGIDYRQV